MARQQRHSVTRTQMYSVVLIVDVALAAVAHTCPCCVTRHEMPTARQAQPRFFALSFTIALNILPNLNVGAVEAASGGRTREWRCPSSDTQFRAARAARAWNVHRLVGLRVTPLARLAPLRVERPEVHQRDLVAVCDRLNNDVQRCRARRCATLGARVGQDGACASQPSAVKDRPGAHELCRLGGVCAGDACCAGRLHLH